MPLSKSDLVRTALFSKCANLVESCYYPLLYHKYDGVSKRENLRYADCGKRAVLDVYRQEKGSPEKLPLFRSLSTRAPFIGLYISAFAGEKRKKLKERFDKAFCEISVPELYADASFPPAFVVGSSRDKPEPESASFFERLYKNGARCEYFLCPGINGMHAASLDCVYGKSGRECYSRAAAFVKSALVL